jgi:hypothetical protein
MATQRYRKICTVCGKEYEFCSGCREYALQPSWKNIYDNENCREIFNVLVAYRQKKISVSEAKTRINACDLSYKNDIRADLFEVLEELLAINEDGEQVEVKEPVQKTSEVEKEVKTIKEEVTEKVEDNKTEEPNEINIASEISGFKKRNTKKKTK